MAINIELIRQSFGAITPHALEVMEHFYEELFSRYPESKSLFDMNRMDSQYKVLAGSLTKIVDLLDNGTELKKYLRSMGSRHIAYGTADEHFIWVGEALVATLEYYFDREWKGELKESWIESFGVIAEEMKTGMKETLNKATFTPRPLSNNITEVAQKISHELLTKSIEKEIRSEHFQTFIKEKAFELLQKAIEEEAARLMTQVSKLDRTAA